MVGRWLSASGVGVFASRKSARACARTLACVAMVGAERPDCRTSRACRTLPLEACQEGCGPVGRLAAAAGGVKRGNVSTAGTTSPGHASRHQALR